MTAAGRTLESWRCWIRGVDPDQTPDAVTLEEAARWPDHLRFVPRAWKPRLDNGEALPGARLARFLMLRELETWDPSVTGTASVFHLAVESDDPALERIAAQASVTGLSLFQVERKKSPNKRLKRFARFKPRYLRYGGAIKAPTLKPFRPNVAHLDLRSPYANRHSMQGAFAEAWPVLRALTVWSGDAGALRVLLEVLSGNALPRLEALSLNDLPADKSTPAALASCAVTPTLTHLQLGLSKCGDKSGLAQVPFTRLRSLGLEGYGETAKTLVALAGSPYLKTLEHLSIRATATAKALRALVGSDHLTSLQHITLVDPKVADVGAAIREGAGALAELQPFIERGGTVDSVQT